MELADTIQLPVIASFMLSKWWRGYIPGALFMQRTAQTLYKHNIHAAHCINIESSHKLCYAFYEKAGEVFEKTYSTTGLS